MIEYRIDEDLAGVRLDKFLRKKLDRVPASHLFKKIRTKKVRVNGKRAQPEQPLQAGDVVSLRGSEETLQGPEGAPARKPPEPKLDTTKLRTLGWSPQMPFDRGLRETVDWYRANEWWWRPITDRDASFKSYYRAQYEAHR